MSGHRYIAVLALLLMTSHIAGRTINARLGGWTVSYDTHSKTFTYQHDGHTVLSDSRPEAAYSLNGKAATCTAADFEKVSRTKGEAVRFVFSGKDKGIGMEVAFRLHDDALLSQLTLTSDNELSSCYLAPIRTIAPQTLDGSECRMLKVPFDNDGFVRYEYKKLDTQMLSYEVTTLFDGVSRHGIVIGSVDHDHWKSGIDVRTEGGNTVSELRAYSGVSSSETHDVLPHGALVGKRVSSATFLLVDADDWRDGMECFARVCNDRQPGRQTWQGGTPFGWQSWGVMATKNNIDIDMAVADFYAGTLRQGGFAAEDGLQIMSIDAWDNLNDGQRRQLTAHCGQQGQMVGIYRSPFSLWWGKDSDLGQKLYGGCEYSARECILTANGEPLIYDGAFCLDPTHPAVKTRMTLEMEEARRQGFRYVKVDFISNGIIQAGRYYNPEVHTAVEAYNEGMAHFASQCFAADGTPMFIALSISPIFPYQYANSRRIACDTWGKISHSEYAMNAIAGGWWTNGFYQRNDPDHIVLVGNDAEKETEGENRARLTTGIASGMLLLADNYDLGDSLTGCGNPSLSVERAKLLLANKDINALARLVSHSFRPVFGCRPFNGETYGAENFAIYQDGSTTYVAVINYADQALSGSLPFDALGLSGKHAVHELWTGTDLEASTVLPYSVPAKDARIYCILGL